MSSFIIREWDASYYCWQAKVWKYGTLAVCPNCLCFFEVNSDRKQATILLSLRHVTGFQRRLVSLVFKAIVVNVENAKPQWFSSLKNREETFYFIEHFWQQIRLFGNSYSRKLHYRNHGRTTSTLSNLGQQEKRQKVFKLLHDSENTLTEAATALDAQGEQFDHASRTMNALHQDLTVAETIMNGLDRWLTKWDITPADNFYEIQLKKEFAVMYKCHPSVSFCPGFLVVTQDQLKILTDKNIVHITLLLKELNRIIVTTPWDLTILKTVIGQSDIIIDISSTHVVYVLKSLQTCCGDRIEYEETERHMDNIVNLGNDDGSGHILPVEALEPMVGNALSTEKLEQLGTATGEQQHQTLSDIDKEDADKITEVVVNMKSLAVSIGQEMSRQLDSLDQLSESVDKAKFRIEKDNKTLRDKL